MRILDLEEPGFADRPRPPVGAVFDIQREGRFRLLVLLDDTHVLVDELSAPSGAS